jgi:hypothetical protein
MVQKIEWVIGLVLYAALGSLLIGHIVKLLRNRIDLLAGPENEPLTRFSWLLGVLEIALYIICIVSKMPFLIGVWLGVKMAGRWTAQASKQPSGEYVRGTVNIFLIGNLLCLFFGIGGGAFSKLLPLFQ